MGISGRLGPCCWDPSEKVGEAALNALGDLKADGAVKPVLEAVKRRGEVQNTFGLGRNICGRKSTSSFTSAAMAIGRIGSAAVEPLTEVLATDDACLKNFVLRALGETRDPSAVPHLAGMLLDANPMVRKEAIHCLGKIKSSTSMNILIQLLAEKDKDVRGSAASALSGHGEMAAVELMTLLLESKLSDPARESAVEALCNLARNGHCPPSQLTLRWFLESERVPRGAIRFSGWIIINVLGNTKTQENLMFMIEALRHLQGEVFQGYVQEVLSFKTGLNRAWSRQEWLDWAQRKSGLLETACLDTFETPVGRNDLMKASEIVEAWETPVKASAVWTTPLDSSEMRNLEINLVPSKSKRNSYLPSTLKDVDKIWFIKEDDIWSAILPLS